ncbi:MULTISPECIES: ribonucleoside-diphosphate reductase subunit alpha [Leeuwenhoekiella]|uniref:Ribonucleoside-diphosphate reductase alpha chain n=1 Tax=Leeuwenhoekiella palythoae TaxID=573501 RepID=A0A1M5VEW9_9FLAO|nr:MULTISPECIES: ribonucleoside-diphosphate reductase subunit alpha [Leeuwenhoekiella]MEC7782136.1 ribonucleoside-diphosphate reductase subunit alpha [Bacteroidota bacterium]MEE3148490.1 ribonucleoside-diphosphate reductase subunit alpha [Bacteroidota bacterium]MEE3225918.1 ribonucleoside-diphosphate reductase subunit alpha [Bacteroidota bacterium]MEE3244386.1 ribonucleoside-diphosphate reductase subunit alpha [Bacteroidota bacterium]RXG30886.1 ribonucleoside-diphosphate reductase alpha chain |tara:strand:+ start:3250 stop:5055 length:1806 start_codon:yes stop_codon:yes gene_type:complete
MRENTTDFQNTTETQVQPSKESDLLKARRDALHDATEKTEETEGSFKWLTEHSRSFLAAGYLSEGVSAEERIREIADRAEEILEMPGFSDKFYKYMGEGYFSLASPVWSNFGKKRGLPISCFGSHIDDDMGNILYTQSEVGMMSKLGGGTSGYFGKIRHRGAAVKNNGYASGAVHIMQLFDKMVDVVSQGSVRRGRFSPYLPISHPDIKEFLEIGTEGNSIQQLTHGVTVDSTWMQEMIDGDTDKREVWAKVLQRRGEMGYPYIFYTDNANNGKPDVYKDKGHDIYASNLCTEIMLPSSDEWSFVCVLSSINVLHYDKWKNTDAVETMVCFLDAVLTEFIDKLEEYRDSDNRDHRQTFMFMERAYNFAKSNRALGLGVLGWHSLLQSKRHAFDSQEAYDLNSEIFREIKQRSYKASEELAEKFGEPEVLKGYGRRNATLNAIAPTTSSAFILGQVSQGIEPIWSNVYVKDIAKIKTTIKNPFLEELFEEKGMNTPEVWRSVRDNDGSVQHLEFLTEQEKDVFKTYAEIDQMAIIYQAANRQNHIDQGQSINLLVHPDMPIKEINKIHITAWKLGLKSLYYQHSMNAAQKFKQKKECVSCEA